MQQIQYQTINGQPVLIADDDFYQAQIQNIIAIPEDTIIIESAPILYCTEFPPQDHHYAHDTMNNNINYKNTTRQFMKVREYREIDMKELVLKKTDREKYLVYDINTHESHFRCDVFNCTSNFKRYEDFVRHRKMHSVERPYACDRCDFTSKRKDNLQSHKKIHLPKKHFCKFKYCTRSDRGFTRKDELKRHYESHIRKLNKKIYSHKRKFGPGFCDSEKINIFKMIDELNEITDKAIIDENTKVEARLKDKKIKKERRNKKLAQAQKCKNTECKTELLEAKIQPQPYTTDFYTPSYTPPKPNYLPCEPTDMVVEKLVSTFEDDQNDRFKMIDKQAKSVATEFIQDNFNDEYHHDGHDNDIIELEINSDNWPTVTPACYSFGNTIHIV